MDDVEDASILLIDPELPGARGLLQEAASKVVLHYSWVFKSLNAGNPLLEIRNWGDCRVTLENINGDFGYVPPPPPSNSQLQTPRPTPENRSCSFSTSPGFPQSLANTTPPSSQPSHTPTPSHWPLNPVATQQIPSQQPSTSQVVPYNLQLMQPPSMFPMSQPTNGNTMTYGHQPIWPPGSYSMIQPPTVEEFRRAYEIMMWFQRPQIFQPLPPPTTPTQPGPIFRSPPPPPTENQPGTISTLFETPRMLGTPATTITQRQDSTDSDGALPGPGNSPGGPSPEASIFPVPPTLSEPIPPPPPFDISGPSTSSVPLQTHPKLFEHEIGRPIMFCVPITLKARGKIAEIFRVGFQPSIIL